MPYGIGAPAANHMPTETAAVQLLQAALAAGINFIDTAREYGQSEMIIGKAFKTTRSEVVIATKCKHLHQPDTIVQTGFAASIEQSLAESLDALQTDYADIFMLHDNDPQIVHNPEVIDTFGNLKKSGRIRATGVSTYTPEETLATIESGHWDVIQVPFNLLDQRQEQLFDLAHRKGVAVVVRSVLMKGLLAKNTGPLHPALHSVEQCIARLVELAQQWQMALPALATRFALSFKEISAVLVGLDKPEYLVQSLQTADGRYFSPAQLQQLQSMAYVDPAFINLHHWHVKGWLV